MQAYGHLKDLPNFPASYTPNPESPTSPCEYSVRDVRLLMMVEGYVVFFDTRSRGVFAVFRHWKRTCSWPGEESTSSTKGVAGALLALKPSGCCMTARTSSLRKVKEMKPSIRSPEGPRHNNFQRNTKIAAYMKSGGVYFLQVCLRLRVATLLVKLLHDFTVASSLRYWNYCAFLLEDAGLCRAMKH